MSAISPTGFRQTFSFLVVFEHLIFCLFCNLHFRRRQDDYRYRRPSVYDGTRVRTTYTIVKLSIGNSFYANDLRLELKT